MARISTIRKKKNEPHSGGIFDDSTPFHPHSAIPARAPHRAPRDVPRSLRVAGRCLTSDDPSPVVTASMVMDLPPTQDASGK